VFSRSRHRIRLTNARNSTAAPLLHFESSAHHQKFFSWFLEDLTAITSPVMRALPHHRPPAFRPTSLRTQSQLCIARLSRKRWNGGTSLFFNSSQLWLLCDHATFVSHGL